MQPAAILSQENLTSELLRGIAETVSVRAGETEAMRSIRQQTAMFSVMGFLPRDAVEIMLAGQCVVFNHLLADGARDLLHGQAEPMKLKTRPQLLAVGNVFLKSLAELTRLQLRPIDQIAVLPVGHRFEAIKAEAKNPAAPVRHEPAAPVSPPAVPTVAARPLPGVEPPPLPPLPASEAPNAVGPDPGIAHREETQPKFAPLPPEPSCPNPAPMPPDRIGAVGNTAAQITRDLTPPGTREER